jgi:hypothetical protein
MKRQTLSLLALIFMVCSCGRSVGSIDETTIIDDVCLAAAIPSNVDIEWNAKGLGDEGKQTLSSALVGGLKRNENPSIEGAEATSPGVVLGNLQTEIRGARQFSVLHPAKARLISHQIQGDMVSGEVAFDGENSVKSVRFCGILLRSGRVLVDRLDATMTDGEILSVVADGLYWRVARVPNADKYSWTGPIPLSPERVNSLCGSWRYSP